MIQRDRLPMKADDGGEAIAALILVGLAIAAIAFVVAVIVIAAIAVAPTAGGVYWLSRLNQRFEISDRKKVICALVGVGLFALPIAALALMAPPMWQQNGDNLIAALWMGTLFGFCGAALFLSIEAYRQVFWQHRKKVLEEQRKAISVRFRLWKAQWALNRLQKALTRKERDNEHIVHEHKRLAEMVGNLIRSYDAAFYSAERLRWQRECAKMNIGELEAKLDRLNQAIARMPHSDPRSVTLTLEAAVVRLEAQDRALGVLEHGSYQEAIEARQGNEGVVSELRQRLQTIQNNVNTETTSIQQLRNTKPAVN